MSLKSSDVPSFNLTSIQKVIKFIYFDPRDWYYSCDNRGNIEFIYTYDQIIDSETEMAAFEWNNELHLQTQLEEDYINSEIDNAFKHYFFKVKHIPPLEFECLIIKSIKENTALKTLLGELINELTDIERRKWVGPMIVFGKRWNPKDRLTHQCEHEQIYCIFKEFGKKSHNRQ